MKKQIPNEVKKEVEKIVKNFNKKYRMDYIVKFKGEFLYLDKIDGFMVTKIGRLKFGGDMQSWSFAVFKYSSEVYDPNELFFPGQDKLDGTIEGALQAGLEIY